MSCRLHAAVEPSAPQILARFMHKHAVEEQQREQVGYGHEGVEAVGDIPHHTKTRHASGKHRHDVDRAVDKRGAAAGHILHGALAIVAPSERGAEGERYHAHAHYQFAEHGNLGEGGLGKLRPVAVVDVGIGHDAAHDDNACHGADDDSVPECARRRHQSLAHRVARLCGGGDDGSRTEPRLVGEQAAGYAVAGGKQHRAAHKAAAGRLGRERRAYDKAYGRKEAMAVDAHYVHAAEDVEQGHHWHKKAAHAGDALHAAYDDGCRKEHHGGASDVWRKAPRAVEHGGYGVGLDGGADAERGHDGEQGEEHGQPLPSQAALYGIHRTAEHPPVGGLHAVLHGKQTLSILRRYAEHAGEPAPEHCSRAAHGHSSGHADDVARADGGGKGGGEGAKLRHVAVGAAVAAHRKAYRGEYLALGKAQTDGEEDMGAEQKNYHRPAPEKTAE